MRRRTPVVLALGVALAPAAAASAAPRPDLRVSSVGTASSQEAPGSLLTARVTIRNSGSATARASRLGLYLSRDGRKGSGDFRLRPRPRVSARGPRTRLTLRRTLRVPSTVPAGRYVLIACADDTRRVRETRERNNCRSATRRLPIVVPTLPRPGPAPAPTPGTTTTITTPSLTVTGLVNGSRTSDTTPGYSGTARSDGPAVARVEASVDGAAFGTAGVACSGCGTANAGWTFTPTAPLPEGPHGFAFRAIDAGGRASPTITRTLVVDTTAPTFASISATSGSSTVTAAFSEPLACITVDASDFSAQINASPVSVAQASCTGSSAVVTLTLGSAPTAGQTVSVTLSGVVSDPAGNVVSTPVARSDPA